MVQLTPWLAIRGPSMHVETCKSPLPSTPTVGVRNHQLVNFYDCMFRLGWCAKRIRRCILVRAECPYVQWQPIRVTCTWVCCRGYKRLREEWAPKFLVEVKWSLSASPLSKKASSKKEGLRPREGLGVWEREKNGGKRKTKEVTASGLCHPPPPVGVSCWSRR
jgi:hypothetical protein